MQSNGVVRWFSPARGFGFILNESGEDVFVHKESIQTNGSPFLLPFLTPDQIVSFTQVRGDTGWAAIEVVPVSLPQTIIPIPVGDPNRVAQLLLAHFTATELRIISAQIHPNSPQG